MILNLIGFMYHDGNSRCHVAFKAFQSVYTSSATKPQFTNVRCELTDEITSIHQVSYTHITELWLYPSWVY